MTIRQELLADTNKILETLHEGFSFFMKGNTLYLKTSKKDFRWGATNSYPVFYNRLSCGGTKARALTQLARHLQGRPVLPLSVWKHWGGPNILLWREQKDKETAIELLKSIGWPETGNCILCGKSLVGKPYDWYSLGKKAGTICLSPCKDI